MTSLGEKIRRMRRKRNLTLAQLAELTHVSSVTIHNIERNIYEPKISTLYNLSQALDTPLNYFTEAASEGLFVRERSGRFNKAITPRRKLDLPQVQRLELDSNDVFDIENDSGLLVILHLIFGRIEATSGERSVMLLPGDNLYTEVFEEVKITAKETSLCVMTTYPEESLRKRD